jgi:hypothetical protein
MKHAITFAGVLLLAAACGDKPVERPAAAPEDPGLQASPMAPPILPPEEVANPAEPPSYEVAIASAAADHNAAKKRCSEQPEAVRTQCEQEANAAFADAQQGLQDLRGNQQ